MTCDRHTCMGPTPCWNRGPAAPPPPPPTGPVPAAPPPAAYSPPPANHAAAPAPAPGPAPAPAAPKKPSKWRPAGSVNFFGMAALGATFAGFLSHHNNPDALTTSVAVVMTFFGTVVALYILHLAFRLFVMLAKVAIPGAILLAIGCANGWDWAEDTTDWLFDVGEKTAVAADEQWREWRAR